MNETALSQLLLKDTAFQDLMQSRIFNVLLIASPYDAFMMEEDGRVEEQLYFEYVSLNLSSPPRVARVAHVSEALAAMEQPQDLVPLTAAVERFGRYVSRFIRQNDGNLCVSIQILTFKSVCK